MLLLMIKVFLYSLRSNLIETEKRLTFVINHQLVQIAIIGTLIKAYFYTLEK